MKNILFSLLVLMMATVALSNEAFAGGGKKTGRLEVTNQNAASGRAITVWVLPQGTKAPVTVGEARKLTPRREVPAQKTESVKVPTGRYFVVAVDTLVFGAAADSTPLTTQLIATKNPVVVGSTTIQLTTKTVGAAPSFTPEIKP